MSKKWNPRPRPTTGKPHTPATVRAILAKRTERCHKDCPGWVVSQGNYGLSIEVCDECHHHLLHGKTAAVQIALSLTDDDVALLPEARRALNAARREAE